VSVYVDTSALYALLVASEERHEAVVRTFRGLVQSGRALHTTSYVLLETCALLQHRIGLAPVRDLSEHIVPLLTVEWVTESLHRSALTHVLREDRRTLSLVDCVGLELMRAHGIREAFALDAHFSEAGHRVLPAKGRG
jgi:predicted nucleic acid-binding protein